MNETLILTYPARTLVSKGQRLLLAGSELTQVGGCAFLAVGGLPRLAVGTYIGRLRETPFLQVAGQICWSMGPDSPAVPVYLVDALHDGEIMSGASTVRLWTQGLSLASVTLSDKGAAGLRLDKSGPLVGKILSEHLEISISHGYLLPDEEPELRALLTSLALTQGYDIVVTTGGTGLGPRDVTPEATLAVIEKRLPGFEEAMRAASLAKTPHAVISRAVCGVLGQSLILNLPGSPKAVAENLEPLLPALGHALAKLKGDPSDCAKP